MLLKSAENEKAGEMKPEAVTITHFIFLCSSPSVGSVALLSATSIQAFHSNNRQLKLLVHQLLLLPEG